MLQLVSIRSISYCKIGLTVISCGCAKVRRFCPFVLRPHGRSSLPLDKLGPFAKALRFISMVVAADGFIILIPLAFTESDFKLFVSDSIFAHVDRAYVMITGACAPHVHHYKRRTIVIRSADCAYGFAWIRRTRGVGRIRSYFQESSCSPSWKGCHSVRKSFIAYELASFQSKCKEKKKCNMYMYLY